MTVISNGIVVAILAWLFKELYGSFNRKDELNSARIDAALKIYTKALCEKDIAEKKIALAYLRNDLTSKYSKALSKNLVLEDENDIDKILNNEIYRLKNEQYDIVSGEMGVKSSLANWFKRTPIPNIFYTFLFFFVPFVIFAAMHNAFTTVHPTINLNEDQQFLTLLNYLFGFIFFTASIIRNTFNIDLLPRYKNPPKNEKDKKRNIVITAVGVFSFMNMFIGIIMVMKFNHSFYLPISAISFSLSFIVWFGLWICIEGKIIVGDFKGFKNLFKIDE